jgi:3D (Asp-Asp-Asp) domain-containing protein
LTRGFKYANIKYTAEGQFLNTMNINIFKNNAILRENTPLIGSILAGILVGICLLGIVMPQTTNADLVNTKTASYVAKTTNEAQKAVKTINVVITAYSSSPDQTDDTPFITASNKRVRAGIVANNMLPFGTKIRIPELYGDQIFVVEDRMNKRMGDYRLDIWMPTRTLAVNFGVKTAQIEVLEN